jgi:hypothetical protein
LAKDAAKFLAGGHVAARQFSFEILKLKRLLSRASVLNQFVNRVKKNEEPFQQLPIEGTVE